MWTASRLGSHDGAVLRTGGQVMFWVPLTGPIPVLRGVGAAPADLRKEGGRGVLREDCRRQVSFFTGGNAEKSRGNRAT
jgi:hypothetical protein